MFKAFRHIPDDISDLALNGAIGMHLVFREQARLLQREIQRVFPVLLAILVGGGLGALAIVANNASAKWAALIVVAVAVPSVVLLVNDIKKLILIVLIIDVPFGIDIAIQNQGWHRGGPTGYMVSLMTIAVVVGYALWIIERRPKLRFFPEVTIPALLYLFMVVLSFHQSPHWQLSAFELFLKCQVFLMYFYVVNHVETWADVRLIVTTAAICLLLESALMVLQYFTGATMNVGGLITSQAISEGSGGAGVIGARVSGTLGTPGTAALYLNSMLTLSFGAYLTGKLIDKRLALGAFSLGIIALITTSSRAGWIAFGVAMLIVLGRAIRTEAGRKGTLILLIGGLLIGIFFGGQIQERLRTVKDDKSRERANFMAYNIIEAYPLGVGANTYDLYMSDKYAHPDSVGHTLYLPHNKYLITWAQLGLQGLIAFVLLLIAPVWQARRWLLRTEVAPDLVILAAGLLGGFASHLVQMGSENFNSGPPVQLLWFIIAMIVVVGQLVSPTEPVAIRPTAKNVTGSFPLIELKSEESK